MKLPRFLLGMIGALFVFAVVTYFLTGSFWTTLLQTAICGVFVQAGYFVIIVILVAREKAPSGDSGETGEADTEAAGKQKDDAALSGKVGALRNARRMGSPK